MARNNGNPCKMVGRRTVRDLAYAFLALMAVGVLVMLFAAKMATY